MRVFLAHSSADKPAVRQLYQRLKADGFEPWLDEENLLAGQVWDLQVERAIRASEVVIVLFSRHTTARPGFVNSEIRVALEVAAEQPDSTIFIIPARLEPTEVPLSLRQFQFVDLYIPSGYDMLIQTLHARERAVGDLFERATNFEYTTLVGIDGWPLASSSTERAQIVIDVREVNARLIRDLQDAPQRLYDLSPEKFEELIADLLARQGYSITRTPFSKDGGFDMYAARKDRLGEFMYLVECKRYTPPHKVGVNVVRSLRGVLSEQRATGAAVVTTSYFTAGAKAFRKQFAYQLMLHDYVTLQDWLGITKRSTA